MPVKLNAYRTTDPAAINAYRTAVIARAGFTARLRAATAAIGANTGAVSTYTAFGGPEKIVGLDPDNSGVIPVGWRVVRGDLVPARSGPGAAAARRWLKEHQPAATLDPRYVLKSHGLAYQSRVPTGGGTYDVHLPIVDEHNGVLWACYQGEPDGDFPGEDPGLTWEPRPLEEYYAAKRAALAQRERPATTIHYQSDDGQTVGGDSFQVHEPVDLGQAHRLAQQHAGSDASVDLLSVRTPDGRDLVDDWETTTQLTATA